MQAGAAFPEGAFERAASLGREGAGAGLLLALEEAGYQARIVGGAVRNALLGRVLSDIDIATTALPRQVMEACEAKGLRTIPTGIDHGTVTVLVAGQSFEITTLREDIATDGRHAVVRFGESFEQDAARRDFTINAMSVGRDGVVHDFFGGMGDLAQRRVRFIGDAPTRLREDYLRALRFLRFSAEYGDGSLDKAGLAAILAERAGLARLSAERVRQEVLKLFNAPQAVSVLRISEVPHHFVGGLLGAPLDLARLEAAVAGAAELGLAQRDMLIGLFAASGETVTDVERLRLCLKLSNEQAEWLANLARVLALCDGGASPRHLAFRGPNHLAALAALRPKTFGETACERRDMVAALQKAPPVFAPGGGDVIRHGIAPGPRVGAILNSALDAWITRDLPDDPRLQHQLLDEAIRKA